MTNRLRDKRALVTGASRGIGAEIARAFAHEGADLILVTRSQNALEALQQEIVAARRKPLAEPAFDPKRTFTCPLYSGWPASAHWLGVADKTELPRDLRPRTQFGADFLTTYMNDLFTVSSGRQSKIWIGCGVAQKLELGRA